MPRRWRFRIEDILASIAKIERYTRDSSFESFRDDELVIDAVLRNLEIIGEAARNTPEEVRGRWQSIPWTEIVGLRNLIAHEYQRVRIVDIWQTVREDLPAVEPLFRQILMEEPDDKS